MAKFSPKSAAGKALLLKAMEAGKYGKRFFKAVPPGRRIDAATDFAKLSMLEARANLEKKHHKPIIVPETSEGDGRKLLLETVFESLAKKQELGGIKGKLPVVGVTGLGASGKTSSAQAIAEEFEKRTGKKALIVSLDNYWREPEYFLDGKKLDSAAAKKIFADKKLSKQLIGGKRLQPKLFDKNGNEIFFGYDVPQAYNLNLAAMHLNDLLSGKPARLPIIDSRSRLLKGYCVETPENYGLIVVEGLFPCHPMLKNFLDLSIGINRNLKARYGRRLIRDPLERGRTEQEVKEFMRQRELIVRKSVQPFIESSDIIFERKIPPENWQVKKRTGVSKLIKEIEASQSMKELEALNARRRINFGMLRAEAEKLIKQSPRAAFARRMAMRELGNAYLKKRAELEQKERLQNNQK